MGKPRIDSLSFVKAVCCIGIVIYHFTCHLQSGVLTPFVRFANGDLGPICVTVFFAVSGALLSYRYSDGIQLSKYYVNRWKSIFPMFYLAYFYYWIQYVLSNKTPFFAGHPSLYLLTLFGLDGYLSPRLPTYYILGEWFLGGIIILYALFPLILFCFRKNKWLTFAAGAVVYLVFLDKPITSHEGYWTISSCLISFLCGMTLMSCKKQALHPASVIFSLAGIGILSLVKLPLSLNLTQHLMGIFLFVALWALGEWVMKFQSPNRLFGGINRLSYGIFLLHHQVILQLLGAWQPAGRRKAVILLAISLALTLCGAKVLTLVTDALLKWVNNVLSSLRREKSLRSSS